MKKISFLLLLTITSLAQIKEVGTFNVNGTKIKIGAQASYFFIAQDGNILRPLGSNMLKRPDVTTTYSVLDDLLPSRQDNGGLGLPNIATAPAIDGYWKMYFYDPSCNCTGWNYQKKGTLIANQYNTLTKAKAQIKAEAISHTPVPKVDNTTPPKVDETIPPKDGVVVNKNLQGFKILSAEKDGIVDLNSDGSIRYLWMKIVQVNDSTITDAGWNNNPYHNSISWKFDLENQWHTEPLVNVVIPKTKRGLPIAIEKIYYGGSNGGNFYQPNRTMQQLILPIGEVQQPIEVSNVGEAKFVPEKIPSWFSIPTNSLLQDHFRNPNFPKGFIVPKNKTYWATNIMPIDATDYNGKNPLLSSGWTQVESKTNPVDGASSPRENQCYLMGDAGFANLSDPNNTSKWDFNFMKQMLGSNKYLFFDWEHFDGSKAGILDKLKEANNIAVGYNSDFGLWAQGTVNIASFAINGITNSTSLNSWDNSYNNPNERANFLIKDSGAKISNNFYYHAAYMEANYLYQTMAAHELGKKVDASIRTVPSAWIMAEHIDGYKPQEWDIKMPNGVIKKMKKKYNVPASQVYADILWGAVWDGLYHFETGLLSTDDMNYAYNEYDDDYDAYALSHKINIRGKLTVGAWKGIYYGFYNYTHLGLWQQSQSHIKPIIENNNEWVSPEYMVKDWRTGVQVRPHYAQFYKEPVIKYKLSTDGNTALVIAQNPYSSKVEEVKIKINGKISTLVLNSSWPVIGTINFQ